MRRIVTALVGSTLVLAAATATASQATAATAPRQAAPASSGLPCIDTTNSITIVHSEPYDIASTWKTLHTGSGVSGTCKYFDDGLDDHWFMEVALATGGKGYIWVQHLKFGSQHLCYYTPASDYFKIGTTYCRLIQEDPPRRALAADAGQPAG